MKDEDDKDGSAAGTEDDPLHKLRGDAQVEKRR
jgi:hypothetical protein